MFFTLLLVTFALAIVTSFIIAKFFFHSRIELYRGGGYAIGRTERQAGAV